MVVGMQRETFPPLIRRTASDTASRVRGFDNEPALKGAAALFVAHDLLDEVDDAPPELRLLDAHERLGKR